MFIDDEAEAWDGSDGQVDDDEQQDHGTVTLHHIYSFRLIQRQNSLMMQLISKNVRSQSVMLVITTRKTYRNWLITLFAKVNNGRDRYQIKWVVYQQKNKYCWDRRKKIVRCGRCR
jgi:hypothetical protein